MIIGVPQEVKNNEFRVGLTPGNVSGLCKQGHSILVQRGAGEQIGLCDESYQAAGATLINSAAEVFHKAEMIVKVKEPQAQECAMLHEDQILFTYLHLAPDPKQTKALMDSGATCIAYETVTSIQGALPLLAPMSEVAGRMSIQAAASHLEKTNGGLGVLMAGVPGVSPAKIVILGAGVVGRNALQMAVGMGADICIFDRDIDRLRQIDLLYGNRVRTFYSDSLLIEQEIAEADVVIGAVLLPGAAAPQLVSRNMVKKMKAGAVVVDVAIDQGGCFETSELTDLGKPVFKKFGVSHYCVPNIPSLVSQTASIAMSNLLTSFVLKAGKTGGVEEMLWQGKSFMKGTFCYKGHVTHASIAKLYKKPHKDIQLLLLAR
jgi:alanine dehydrogenase